MESLPIDLDSPGVFLFVGRPKSGKSYCLRSLIKDYARQGKFSFGKVYTRTKFNEDYNFMPAKHVEDDYSEENLEAYINSLKAWREKHRKPLPPNFIIFDDLLGAMSLNTGFLSNLISIHRHYNLTIFLTAQYLMKGTSTVLRECVTTAFLWKTIFHNSRDGIFKAFGGYYKKESDFLDMFDSTTSPKHQCLVYNARARKKSEAYWSFMAPSKVSKFKLQF